MEKEVGSRLAGHGTGEQRLARARRPDEQDALRRFCAQIRVAAGVLEVVADLAQLDQRLGRTGDIAEREFAFARLLPFPGPLGERGECRALVFEQAS